MTMYSYPGERRPALPKPRYLPDSYVDPIQARKENEPKKDTKPK